MNIRLDIYIDHICCADCLSQQAICYLTSGDAYWEHLSGLTYIRILTVQVQLHVYGLGLTQVIVQRQLEVRLTCVQTADIKLIPTSGQGRQVDGLSPIQQGRLLALSWISRRSRSNCVSCQSNVTC